MKQQVALPVVVKGIMGADDAKAAVNSGADALIVSNHGGRILDFNRSALEALPEVVEAVGGKVPVLLDSGVRSGGDIVKALALGAKAVLIGRPVAWGVGAFGARGVERVFAILAEEMQRVLTMTGVAHVRGREPVDFVSRRVGRIARPMIFVIWAIIFVFGIWIISTYNGLTALRLRIQNAWRQIDVQLKRRYDLIPNLVETVKGYMQYEQDTLQKVIDARSQAMAAKGVKESAEAQTALTQSLGKVFALMENYPELKASKNVSDLQEELTTTENQIAFARQYYNDLVTQYNTKQQVFPSNLLAGLFGFKPSEFFEVAEAEKALPRVNLSLSR